MAITKNTVDGGNPSEPIHGFNGAVAGEIIQSVTLVPAGTDTPVDPAHVFDGGTFGYASGTAAATVDVPSTARLREIQVLAGSPFAAVTIGGGATIAIPGNTPWSLTVSGLAIGTDVVITGAVVTYFVAWVS